MQFAYTAECLTKRTERKGFCSSFLFPGRKLWLARGKFRFCDADHAPFTLSHRRPGGEGRVRGANEHVKPLPTSPSRRYATGPSLSPPKGGEGLASP
jgi:hypothetical protein